MPSETYLIGSSVGDDDDNMIIIKDSHSGLFD